MTITPDSDVNAITKEIIHLGNGKLDDPDLRENISTEVSQALIRIYQEEIRTLREDREKLADDLLAAETLLLKAERDSSEAASSQLPSRSSLLSR